MSELCAGEGGLAEVSTIVGKVWESLETLRRANGIIEQ